MSQVEAYYLFYEIPYIRSIVRTLFSKSGWSLFDETEHGSSLLLELVDGQC